MLQSPAQSSSPSRIRASTARFMTDLAKAAFENDTISFEELGVIRMAMKELAKTGLLPREPEKRLVDINEVSRLLTISVTSLKRWLANGTINLPKVRLGGAVRFRLSDVEALMGNIPPNPQP